MQSRQQPRPPESLLGVAARRSDELAVADRRPRGVSGAERGDESRSRSTRYRSTAASAVRDCTGGNGSAGRDGGRLTRAVARVCGAKDRRPASDRLLADARRRRFDVLAVVKLDRLARSVRHLTTLTGELKALGVDLVALDRAIDTSTPSGRLSAGDFFALMSCAGVRFPCALHRRGT